MPEPHQSGQQNAQRRDRGSHVVAQVVGIAEDVAGAVEVIRIPSRQRQQRQQVCGALRQSAPRQAPLRRPPPATSGKRTSPAGRRQHSVSVTATVVSFATAARAAKAIACQRRPRRCEYSVHSTSAKAAISSCAITDCENTVGDSAVSTTVAVATGALATLPPQQPERGEAEGRHQQHGRARHQRRVGGELPAQGQPQHHQRRMRVGEGGVRNQIAGEKNVARRRNEVSGLVPEVGQAKQRKMHQPERGEDGSETKQGRSRRACGGCVRCLPAAWI